MLFFQKPKTRSILLLILDSGGAAGAVAEIDAFVFDAKRRREKPVIVRCARERFYNSAETSVGSLANARSANGIVKKTLRTVVSRLVEPSRRGLPDGIVCCLSSPWLHSKIKRIAFERDRPFTVTSGLVEKLISGSESPDESGQFGFLRENKITRFAVNGYAVRNPYGLEAKSIEIDLVSSFMSEPVTRAIEDALEEFIAHGRMPAYRSFPVSASLTWSGLVPERGNFIFMSVGGEISDIAVVRGEVVSSLISLPFGYDTLAMRASDFFGISPREAVSFMRAYAAGVCCERASDDFSAFLKAVLPYWQERFREALVYAAETDPLPSKLFIAAPAGSREIISCLAASEPFAEHLTGSGRLSPVTDIADLRRLCFARREAKLARPDDSLILGTLFVDKQGMV